jgi:hypothetical protein
MYETDLPGSTLTVTANTTAIGVDLIQTTGSGRIAWSIDGEPEKTEDLWAGWLQRCGLYVRSFLWAGGQPRKDRVLTLRVLPKPEKADGNLIRIGGNCVTNPKP